jgi:hypothetical protein
MKSKFPRWPLTHEPSTDVLGPFVHIRASCLRCPEFMTPPEPSEAPAAGAPDNPPSPATIIELGVTEGVGSLGAGHLPRGRHAEIQLRTGHTSADDNSEAEGSTAERGGALSARRVDVRELRFLLQPACECTPLEPRATVGASATVLLRTQLTATEIADSVGQTPAPGWPTVAGLQPLIQIAHAVAVVVTLDEVVTPVRIVLPNPPRPVGIGSGHVTTCPSAARPPWAGLAPLSHRPPPPYRSVIKQHPSYRRKTSDIINQSSSSADEDGPVRAHQPARRPQEYGHSLPSDEQQRLRGRQLSVKSDAARRPHKRRGHQLVLPPTTPRSTPASPAGRDPFVRLLARGRCRFNAYGTPPQHRSDQ